MEEVRKLVDLEYVNKLVYPDYFQPRQFDVLKLRIIGYTIQEMADELGLKFHTARDRLAEIRSILGITGPGGQKELVKWAIENGLITVNFQL